MSKNTENKNYDYLIKLLILGNSGTGKSALLHPFHDSFGLIEFC
jgi:GTPase SAR1 family protein